MCLLIYCFCRCLKIKISLLRKMSLFQLIISTKNLIAVKKQEAHFRARRKASLTIEAAVTIPIFVMVLVFAMFTLRITIIQYGLGVAMRDASREVALYKSDIKEEGNSDSRAVLAKTIGLINIKLKEKSVPTQFVKNGILGINYAGSNVTNNNIVIKANYSVQIPFAMIGQPCFKMTQQVSMRRWTGFDPKEEAWDGMYVYVTPYGEAYHYSQSCAYLNPSISVVAAEDIDGARSLDGSIYYDCPYCENTGGNFYYVTEYGIKYHTKLNCSALKRTVRRELYEEVKDRYHACPKCAGG